MLNAPLLDRRASPDDTLTITRAQLCDAVQRAMLCQAPAITQGIWNVLADYVQQAREQQQALQIAARAAQERTLRQTALESAFGTPPEPAPTPQQREMDALLAALDTEQHMERRLAASLRIVTTPSGLELLAQVQARVREIQHRMTELRAIGATA